MSQLHVPTSLGNLHWFLRAMSGDGSTSALVAAAALGAVGVGALYHYLRPSGGRKLQPIVDLECQTVEAPELGEGARVSAWLPDGKLRDTVFDDARTLYEAVRRGRRVSNNGPMLGRRLAASVDPARPYTWHSYDAVTRLHYCAWRFTGQLEAIEWSAAVGKGIVSLGVATGQDSFVGIYSHNCPEWIVAAQACYSYRIVTVPLYDTLGPDSCSFIVRQTGIQLVFCDDPKKAAVLMMARGEMPTLRLIVVFAADVADDLVKEAEAAGVRVLSLSQLESLGAAADASLPPVTVRSPAAERVRRVGALQPPSPADMATVCYTSGTTGTPKGVILTHGNIVADCTTLEYFVNAKLGVGDVMMGFLPLAHMMERVLENAMFMVGGCVGYFSGDVRTLTDDIKELQPTLLPVVPRVLNRVYDKVYAEVIKSDLKKRLFDYALACKIEALKNGFISTDSIWDKLVFAKVRQTLGGRVRMMITGSAPIAPAVLQFIRAATGAVVVEGYGQTECVAACSITHEGDHEPGHVGPPIPCCAVRLVDVDEMALSVARDGRGELCIRGAHVFKGYYGDEQRTRETLDADGWLHTGDVAEFTAKGTIRIVDRKKHIFKLAQGEYVAPEKIENAYARSRFVAQIFVDGRPLEAFLVAIVVPDFEVLSPFAAQSLQLAGATPEQLCADERVRRAILDDMKAVGAESKLNGIEQVKAIQLCAELFSVENDLLTPTFKSKRPQLRRRFDADIDQLYMANR